MPDGLDRPTLTVEVSAAHRHDERDVELDTAPGAPESGGRLGLARGDAETAAMYFVCPVCGVGVKVDLRIR